MTFTNDVATFALKDGESKTATEVSVGLDYTVTESGNDGYKVTANNVEATVAKGILQLDPTTVTFNNRKEGDPKIKAPASVTLTAEKTLDGSAPEGSDFTFLLQEKDGKVLQEKKNIRSAVSFEPLTFDQVGTYTYYIREQAGNDSQISYNPSVYEVIVIVTQPGDYKASDSYQKDGKTYTDIPIFADKTKRSDQPKDHAITVSIDKVWKGIDPNNHPNAVKVQSYKNSTAYGGVLFLNAGNNWNYTWADLDKSASWTVDKVDVLTGYSK